MHDNAPDQECAGGYFTRVEVASCQIWTELSDYVLGLLERDAQRPTIEELTERIKLRGSVEPKTPAADILREERDAR